MHAQARGGFADGPRFVQTTNAGAGVYFVTPTGSKKRQLCRGACSLLRFTIYSPHSHHHHYHQTTMCVLSDKIGPPGPIFSVISALTSFLLMHMCRIWLGLSFEPLTAIVWFWLKLDSRNYVTCFFGALALDPI